MKRFDTSTFLMSASLLCSGCATPPSPPPANSGMMQVAEISDCEYLAVGEGTVWALCYRSSPEDYQGLAKIDPSTGQILAKIDIPRGGMHFTGLAVGAGAVWVATQGLIDPATIYKVSIKENRIVAKIAVGSAPIFGRVNPLIAFGEGAVWATMEGTVYKIDPETNGVVSTTELDLPFWSGRYYRPADIAAGDGAVWVVGHTRVFHIDPRTNRVVATIPVDDSVDVFWSNRVLAVGAGSLWFPKPLWSSKRGSGQRTPMIYRIDPQTNQVSAPIPVGKEDELGGITATAAGEGSIWVNYAHRVSFQLNNNNLFKIDPTTNRAEPIIPLGTTGLDGSVGSLAVGEGAVWVCRPDGVWRFPLRSP